MKKFDWKLAAASILFTELVGALSSLISGNIGAKYQALNQPALSPPGWLFGVVWVILYAMMGLALYLIYEVKIEKEHKVWAYRLYGVQLFLNFLWPIVFFTFGQLWAAAVVIILLDLVVILTVIKFWQLKPKAALLLVPYLIWILFATYLNIGFAVLNP